MPKSRANEELATVQWTVCTRILVKNVLSHHCKLMDYHYPPGFHHVVSAVLTL